MSRFIGDAEDFSKPGEPPLLVVASDLLEELGVAECGRRDKQRAVDEWLDRNKPNKVLAISLRKAGFLGENVSNNLSNEPRRTGPAEPDQRPRRGPESRMIPDVGGPDGTGPDPGRLS